ncbi:MAG: hypothetical protein ACE5HP_13060 [Gemmatimonadota bacterium]
MAPLRTARQGGSLSLVLAAVGIYGIVSTTKRRSRSCSRARPSW